MKTIFYADYEMVTKEKAIELLVKERLERFVAQAKESFMNDPLEENSWYVGGSVNMFIIEFK